MKYMTFRWANAECVCGPESAREKLQHHELIRVASKYPNIAKDYFNNIKASDCRDYQA